MDEAFITHYITHAFQGVETIEADGTTFFFYNPRGDIPPDYKFPFVTLVTNDFNDTASDLNRPSIFRLNIGVSKETYRSLFGPQPPPLDASGMVNTGHDFTALDQLMPHPVYAPQSWICVLNPTTTTFQKVTELLAEAYQRTADKHKKRGSTHIGEQSAD